MTVQLNEGEFLNDIEKMFDHVNDVNNDIVDTISDDLKLRVITNILLGYTTLGWQPTSEAYRKYRMKRGLPPITMGHTLDMQLVNSVMRDRHMQKDLSTATVYIPSLDPNEYELHQEFGFVSRGGKGVPARPFFQPAIEEVADKFTDTVREILEHSI